MFDLIFGKNTFIGVDIGTSSIKVVELKMIDNRPVLSNYAWMPLSENMPGRGDINSEYFYAALSHLIKKIFKTAKLNKSNVYISLPAFGGLITLIDFPEMAPEDMEQAIKFEASKYIPTALDEVVINWDVVGKRQVSKGVAANVSGNLINAEVGNATEDKTMLQVLLVVASKEKIQKYENLIRKSGLELKSVSLEVFPIVRSLVGSDPGNFIVVDIGAKVCNIILVEKGIIKSNRNIDAGGVNMTGTIAKSMDIDSTRAEELKISDKNFFENNSTISFFTLETIIGEIDRILKSYIKDSATKKIDGVVLSGGTSRMTGLLEYFSARLQITTVIGNPLSRIKYDEILTPVISDIQSRFSVCIGLALSGVDEHLKAKNKLN